MQYDFSLDGVKASQYNVALQKPVTVSPLTPRYIEQFVPMYGTYHTFIGYEEQTMSISAYVLSNTLSADLKRAYDFLLRTTERTIVLYEDNVAYYECKGVLQSGGEIDCRSNVLNPFTLTFAVRGGKVLDGEVTTNDMIVIDENNDILTDESGATLILNKEGN